MTYRRGKNLSIMPTYASLFIPGRSARPNYTDCIYLYHTWVVTCPTTRSVCTWYVLELYLGCHVIHLHVNMTMRCLTRPPCTSDSDVAATLNDDSMEVDVDVPSACEKI